MKKITNFLVEKRILVLIVFIIFTIVSFLLIDQVNQNNDMTKYLPDNSSMKKGLDIMNDEFSDTSNASSSFKIMFTDLSKQEKTKIQHELTQIKDVTVVDYDINSEEFNKDNHTLYEVHVNYEKDSEKATTVYNKVIDNYKNNYEINTGGDIDELNTEGLPLWISGLAVLILMIVLFIMCSSWFEPILFLITIMMSIIINMGTNAFLNSVSTMTYSIAAILQLVLSMDYSIILINRYRQELEKTNNKNTAMKNALRKAFSAISSSSLTTIVGLLALVFMSYKIGIDMGIVLAKGVFISLICIFTILPALILIFDKIIDKTKKKPLHLKMNYFGKYSSKWRYAIIILFLLLFISSFFLKNNTDISYVRENNKLVDEVFPKENTIVLLYDNDDENNIYQILDEVEDNKHIKSINSYSTTLGKKMTYSEFATSMELDETVVQLLYYNNLVDKEDLISKTIPFGKLLVFIQTDVATNEQFSKYLSNDMLQQMETMKSSSANSSDIINQELTIQEFSQITGTDISVTTMLYEYYFATHGEEPIQGIELYDFINYLVNDVSKDETFSLFIDEDSFDKLTDVKSSMDKGIINLVGKNHSRFIITTDLDESSDLTTSFIKSLEKNCTSILKNNFYMIGDSPMAYEMSQIFKSELNRITIITAIAIFTVIAITFQSIIIPFILVLIIQCSIYTMMSIIGFQGYSIYFMALLIVQCILMGATIDYGILFTTYYMENRKDKNILESLISSYRGSIHTILTSASIMILITGILGYTSVDPNVGQICESISKGSLCATLLIIFILPGTLTVFDKLIFKGKAKTS
ncbi:MAG: efflux RND transporter permease subunit [Clostridiales bacterium]